jgi:hypothetical protein
MPDIPSDEDFARASRLMEEEYRNLAAVTANIDRRFQPTRVFTGIHLFVEGDTTFRAIAFLRTNLNIREWERAGLLEQLKDAVYDELEQAGRGQRPEINVIFEIESDENVQRNYKGNRDYRLR